MGQISQELSLANWGVLVTRPKLQADDLCVAIESHGGRAIRFPVVEIASPVNFDSLYSIIRHLEDFDIAIFISPNAVSKALDLLKNQQCVLPESLSIAAVGKGSAKALSANGLRVDIFPQQQFNSEALLSQAEMNQVQNKRILIFRGEGGRELLAATLRQRGAKVTYAEVYRRLKPKCDIATLIRQWSKIDVVTVTSNGGLCNLYEMMGDVGRARLLSAQLLVVSHRAASLAKKMGFSKPAWVTKEASNGAIIEALQQIKLNCGK